MTRDALLAEAAAADRKADALCNEIEAAHMTVAPDAFGNRPLTPAGYEGQSVEASDLRRQATYLRAEAGEASPTMATSPVRLPAPKTPAPAPPKPFAPAETVESVARRILASGSTAEGSVPFPRPSAVDPVEAVVARILAA